MKSASELAAEIQGKSTEEQEGSLDPKTKREYTFNFEFKDEWGKVWKGSFTNVCLSPHQKINVGVLKASLLGKLPYDSLDVYTRALAERISHMTISLIKRPPWAQELGDFLDENMIHALYEEVSSHEDTFHQRKADQTVGKDASTDGPGGA